MKNNMIRIGKFRFSLYEGLLLLLVIISLSMSFYVNLFQLKFHMGYDAAVNYLQAAQIWKSKTLLLNDWSYQNTLAWDTSIPIAAVFYGITGNLFLSYGFVNEIILVLICLALFKICKQLDITNSSSLIVLLMFLCPYVTIEYNNANDLGWISSIITSGAWWNIRILCILIIFITFISIMKRQKCSSWVLLSGILCILTGLSSGYFVLVIFVLPIFILGILKIFSKNSIKVLNVRAFIYLISLCLMVVVAKYAIHKLYGYQSRDSSMVLTGMTEFWKNIGSILLGLFGLLGGMPSTSNVIATSTNGLTYLSSYVLLIICFISVIYFIWKNKKKWATDIGYSWIPISVIITNIILFSVLYTTYGGGIFEIRYLIPTFVMMMITVAFFIDDLDNKLLVKKVGCGILIICLVFKTFSGYYYYNSSLNNYHSLESISSIINENKNQNNEVAYVYFYGTGSTEIDCRNIKCIDLNNIYKYINIDLNTQHWGDYIYHEEVVDCNEQSFLVVNRDEYDSLPEYIKNNYYMLDSVDNYDLYTSNLNYWDLNDNIEGETIYINYPVRMNYNPEVASVSSNEPSIITNGTEGYAFYSKYIYIEKGKYNFTVSYEIANYSDSLPCFELVNKYGKEIIYQIQLSPEKKSIEVSDINLEEGTEYEFRLYAPKDTILTFKNVKTERLDMKKNYGIK